MSEPISLERLEEIAHDPEMTCCEYEEATEMANECIAARMTMLEIQNRALRGCGSAQKDFGVRIFGMISDLAHNYLFNYAPAPPHDKEGL